MEFGDFEFINSICLKSMTKFNDKLLSKTKKRSENIVFTPSLFNQNVLVFFF